MELLDNWQKKNATVSLGGQGSQVSKADIINDATKQLAGAPASIRTSTAKPTYQQVPAQSSGGDDYLSALK